jgi:hypothetical protein
MLHLSGENIDNSFNLSKEFSETLNRRIRWPFTKLPERYARGDFIRIAIPGSGSV